MRTRAANPHIYTWRRAISIEITHLVEGERAVLAASSTICVACEWLWVFIVGWCTKLRSRVRKGVKRNKGINFK